MSEPEAAPAAPVVEAQAEAPAQPIAETPPPAEAQPVAEAQLAAPQPAAAPAAAVSEPAPVVAAQPEAPAQPIAETLPPAETQPVAEAQPAAPQPEAAPAAPVVEAQAETPAQPIAETSPPAEAQPVAEAQPAAPQPEAAPAAPVVEAQPEAPTQPVAETSPPAEAQPVAKAQPEAAPAAPVVEAQPEASAKGAGKSEERGRAEHGHEAPDSRPAASAKGGEKSEESERTDRGAGTGTADQHGHAPQGKALGHDKADHDAGQGAGSEVGAAQHEDAGRHGGFGDNGLGNGLDAPPPGSPPPNPNADTAFDAQGDFAKGGAGHEGSGAQDKVDREDESSGREEHPGHADEPQGQALGHDKSDHDTGQGAGHDAGPEVGAAQHEDAGRHGGFGDNGLGNGLDAPPPGSPPPNPNADTAFDAQGDFAKGGAGHEAPGAQDVGGGHAPAPAFGGAQDSAHADLFLSASPGQGKGGGAGSWTDLTQADTHAPATSPAAHGDWTASVEHEPPKTSQGQGKSGAGLDSAPAPSHAVEAFEQSAQDHHKGHDM
ncbi:MAG: hypothetical protein Q8O35_05045 [Humidesulfovibrio sp.]|uniref:hypothetical protein n=1 Tax=Humidesulfovibrio sp. TaxID=2910988 RepID=UPI002734D2E8|nr:hypothetical protein [Humidesulfovibrio sp.]MDP2847543.1 hypothetical protein [Humidesulfovibrio sp.]